MKIVLLCWCHFSFVYNLFYVGITRILALLAISNVLLVSCDENPSLKFNFGSESLSSHDGSFS